MHIIINSSGSSSSSSSCCIDDLKRGGPWMCREASAKGKQANGVGNPSIEKGDAGRSLPSVTSVTTNNKKHMTCCVVLTLLFPYNTFLAGIKTKWPVDTMS
jgi:hypothetical protein